MATNGLKSRRGNRMNRIGSGWIVAILIAGPIWTHPLGAKDGEGVWTVKSSISNRSGEISRFANADCEEFRLGDFRVTGKNIVSEGTHPAIGSIELTGTLEDDGKISSMGNRRASVWVTGRLAGEFGRGRWGETNFGCDGDWSAGRAW